MGVISLDELPIFKHVTYQYAHPHRQISLDFCIFSLTLIMSHIHDNLDPHSNSYTFLLFFSIIYPNFFNVI